MKICFIEPLNNIFQPFRDEDRQVNFFVSMVWGLSVVSWLRFVFLRIPFLSELTEYVVPAFVSLVIIFSLRHLVKLYSLKDFSFWIILSLIYLLYYWLGPSQNAVFMEEYIPAFFFTVSTFFFVGKAVNDDVFDVFYWLAVLTILFKFISIFITHDLEEYFLQEEAQETQGRAYEVLPYALYVLWYLLKRFSLLSLAVFALSLFMFFAFGCRGVLLCVLTFIILYVFLVKRVMKNRMLFFLCLIIITVGYYHIEDILLYISDIFAGLGYSTRIINIFLIEGLSYDSGRGDLQVQMFDALQYHPFGLGICGAQGVTGSYSHNFFYEFVLSFGWIFGSIICVGVFYYLFKAYKACANDEQKGFFLVLFCESVIHLFVSDIVWKEPYFFMLLGYSAMLIGKNKKTQII